MDGENNDMNTPMQDGVAAPATGEETVAPMGEGEQQPVAPAPGAMPEGEGSEEETPAAE